MNQAKPIDNTIEMRRDKFAHVSNGRRCTEHLIIKQISICPEVDITEMEFPMLECTSFNVDASNNTLLSEPQVLHKPRKSTYNKSASETIVSTAEGHYKTVSISKIKLKNLKPKLTSSVISLTKQTEDQMTFHVENASTPKRIQRSSTPRNLLRLKKNILTSTLIEKKSLSSNLIDVSLIKEKPLKSSAKTSRKLSSKSSTPKRALKKSKKFDCVDFISSTGISNEVNLDQINREPIRPKRFNRKSLKKDEWKNLKYPIKYAPNMRVKDIDRLEVNLDDLYNGSMPSSVSSTGRSFEYNLRPIVNNCYSYGDYKFWIV